MNKKYLVKFVYVHNKAKHNLIWDLTSYTLPVQSNPSVMAYSPRSAGNADNRAYLVFLDRYTAGTTPVLFTGEVHIKKTSC